MTRGILVKRVRIIRNEIKVFMLLVDEDGKLLKLVEQSCVIASEHRLSRR